MKTLLLAAAALPLLATTAVAQDRLDLTGEVDYQCDLTLSGQTTTTLNLFVTTPQAIGGALVTCNDPDGFNISVDSENDSFLVSDDDQFQIEYRFGITAAPGEPTDLNAAGVSLDYADSVNGFNPEYADSAVHQLALFLNPATNLPGGVAVTDTIRFTIDGN